MTSYTFPVKVAISLPDELFADAEATARNLHITRSQLYARALELFLASQQTDPITQKLDELADELGKSDGVDFGRRLIDQGLWEW